MLRTGSPSRSPSSLLRNGSASEREPGVAPMIDVVFLLLIFFLLASRFRADEGEIKTYLPKDRGQGESAGTIDLAEVRIQLSWHDEAGRVNLNPDHGNVVLKVGDVVYPTRRVYDTVTKRGETVPRWEVLLEFLNVCQASYRGPNPKGQPVIIDARPIVPWKHVVSAVDQCIQAGIRDYTFAAPDRDM